MQAIILAGGLGTRISEESQFRPKPMIEIGGKPILWHIMKTYSHHNITDFVICCGYKGYMIKEYFSNYFLHNSDVTFDLKNNAMTVHAGQSEPWKVCLVDTGEHTKTGGRLRRVTEYLDDEFCFTYGDGVSDVDVTQLISTHKKSGNDATVTAVHPPSRFGNLVLKGSKVSQFLEKPAGEGGWINGGFFVLKKSVVSLIKSDDTDWEREPMEELAAEGRLGAYFHESFWQPMDTLRDKIYLEELWNKNTAPWKVW